MKVGEDMDQWHWENFIAFSGHRGRFYTTGLTINHVGGSRGTDECCDNNSARSAY